MTITLGTTPVTLLSEHAVFLGESAALVVSDVHLGKSATFRSKGIPVPEGDTAFDLEKLSMLIKTHSPTRLIIAGDLFHAQDGMSPEVMRIFRDWEKEVTIPVILIEGNHDRMARLFHHDIPIEIIPFIDIDGLRITHDPNDLPRETPGIAGHFHPGISVSESARRSIKTAIFHLKHTHHLILPAFSRFTGIHIAQPGPEDRVFIPVRGKVMELPSLSRSSGPPG